MTTYEQAVDQIFTIFNADWISEATSILGYTPSVFWPGVEEIDAPDLSRYWARASQQTVTDEQASLRNGECGQRYTSTGIVIIQIFCPKRDVFGMTNGRLLSTLARDSFRGNATDNKIWFRNSRILELDPEVNWYRFNVVAEYEYDEIS